MVDNIKLVSGATRRASRNETDRIDKLFGKMEMSYLMYNGKYVNFQRGQDLATGILYFICSQRPDVPGKCMEVLISASNIYPSLVVGVVDGLKMDELFSSKQPVPNPSSSSLAATTAGNHLASIATMMSTAVTGLTSKAAANHADADREETIEI